MAGSGKPEIAPCMTRSTASCARTSRPRGAPAISASSGLLMREASAITANAITASNRVSAPIALRAANTIAAAAEMKRARLSRFQRSPAGGEARSASIAIGTRGPGAAIACRPNAQKIQGVKMGGCGGRSRRVAGVGGKLFDRLDFRSSPPEPELAHAQHGKRDGEWKNVIEQAEQQHAGKKILLVVLPQRHQHRRVE